MFIVTEYAALSSYLKIDKTKILVENGSLIKVESLADSAIILTCIKP